MMMMMMMMVMVMMVVMMGTVWGQEWEVVSPEDVGLSSAALQASEEEINSIIAGRVCFIVVKDGKIAYERYRNGWTPSSMRSGWSTTKGFCSSMYGMAVTQGWANISDLVADYVGNTRECNAQASFRNVLTMTGLSDDPVSNPTFEMDSDGTRCLDTLSDFIAENNPDRLDEVEWMETYFLNRLGMEHFSWQASPPRGGYLHCGYSSQTSCRDLARNAQLWVNNGVWQGERLIEESHLQQARSWQFPNSGGEYGYLSWLQTSDDVDENVVSWHGTYTQCAFSSIAQQAVVISMGDGPEDGLECLKVWQAAKYALVANSSDRTDDQHDDEKESSRTHSEEEKARTYHMIDEMVKAHRPAVEKELQEMQEWVTTHPHLLTEYEKESYHQFLLQHQNQQQPHQKEQLQQQKSEQQRQ
jgi:CubicO group peptidase (beta-lactamase class C family)